MEHMEFLKLILLYLIFILNPLFRLRQIIFRTSFGKNVWNVPVLLYILYFSLFVFVHIKPNPI